MNETLIPKGVSAAMLTKISHHFGGGVYAKETFIPAGMILVQHKHKYDHLSILASGSIILDIDGVHLPITGPYCINVAAGKHHGFKTVTEAVWYCIHASGVADDDALIAEDSGDAGTQLVVKRLQEN